MSLVNDMLRDLDQRRQQPGEGSAGGASIAPAPTLTQSQPKTRWLPLILLCLAVGLAVLGLWLYDNPQLWRDALPSTVTDTPSQAVKPQQPAPQLAAPEPQAEPQAEPQPESKSEPASASVHTPVQADPVATPDQPQPVRLLRSSWLAEENRVRLALELNQAPRQQVQLSTERSLQLQLGRIDLPAASTTDSVLAASPVEWLRAQLHQGDQLSLQLDSRTQAQFEVSAQPIASSEGGYRLLVMVSRAPIPPKPAPIATTSEPSSESAQPSNTAVESVRPSSRTREPRQTTDAVASADQAEVSPAEPIAVAPLSKRQPQSPAQRDRSQVAKARALIGSRQISRAIDQLQTFVAEQPEANRSRALLGTLLIGTGQLNRAEQQVDQGLALSPADVGLKKLKARLLMQAQALKTAIGLLQADQPAVNADAEYHQILAAALQADGQHQQAAETYHGLLRVRSDEPAWWIGLALSLEALEQPQQARQAYQNVLQIPDLKPALAKYVTQRLNRL
ncbi:tetratricopeptide repeat protein [Motiliproteus sp.]|uniref:tetratricopeptide repeat protein n=1 Tax=Motiliproteus sp. TaxID=1898955 RepID=UPI003BAD4710